MRIGFLVSMLCCLALAACAHTMGPLESAARGYAAPETMATNAAECDAGKAGYCIQLASFYMSDTKNGRRGLPAAQRACDLGDATGCVLVQTINGWIANGTAE